jgi:hypothetical protein
LHGYSSRFKQNINSANIPEMVHNLVIKTATYQNFDNKNIEKEVDIDNVIKDIEYNYTDDILKMNDALKISN